MTLHQRIAAVAAIACLAVCGLFWQRANAQIAQAPQAPLPDSQQVIAFLNQTIDWYHHQNPEQLFAAAPDQSTLTSEARQFTDQVLALSFEFARADAHLLAIQAQPPGPVFVPPATERYQEIARRTEAKLRQKEAELNALKQKLPSTTGQARVVLQAAIDLAQSDVDLARTAGETVKGLVQFAAGSSGAGGGGDLLSQIDQLEQTVPQAKSLSARSAAGASQSAPAAAAPAAPATRKAEPSGIIGLASELSALARQRRALDEAAQLTEKLAAASRQLATPISARLRDAFRRGDEIGGQPDSNDPAVLQGQKAEIDALNAQFRRFSTAGLPLSKQRILFDVYKGHLANWRATAENQYRSEWSRLIYRLVGLAIVLMFAFGMSEVWRRATFRYVRDAHRRHQFLLLRRIVMLIVVAIILALSLATDISSFTTFAGLLTAGIAIALQNVILSVAGYFVLIGKYGIRVGDRLQISRVTGNVAEIGLVRLYLVELSGTGSDVFPSGRIVEFPNSVVFDANAGIFKQLPGTHFVWHEATTVLARNTDYRAVEQKMLQSVDAVFAEYREAIDRQHHEMERTMQVSMNAPRPQSRFRLCPAGIEVTIRYPVETDHAAEIDDRITRVLLQATDSVKKEQVGGG